MMRSMFSAVSGLSAHQFKMDVVANNITNVNTVAFKGSRVTFKETYNQTIKGAGGAQDGRGGTNPMQVGLGVDVGSVDVIQRMGAPEKTDNPTDMMINGDGYFMVSGDANFLNRYYTRAGNFVLDDYGNLCTQDGYKVLGYMADDTGRLKTSIEGLKIDRSVVYPPQATKPSVPPIPGEDIVTLNGNLNSGTETFTTIVPDPTNPPDVIGDNGLYQIDGPASKAAGVPVYRQNDKLAEALGHESTIEVYDDFGNQHNIKLIFTKMQVNPGDSTTTPPTDPTSEWQVDAFYMVPGGAMLADGESTGWKIDDTSGTITVTPGTDPGGFEAKSFKLTFDKDGNMISDPANKEMNITIGTALTHGAGALTFPINLNKMTQISDTSKTSIQRKGYKQGVLDGYSVAPTGEIIGNFSNGMRRVLGRVAIANFRNPAGLEKTQSNMYQETRNSGNASIGLPGSNGFANISPGTLEMSNVDLGREFTYMITTQRGFQANSKVITTTDEMLQELVNLKR
ncbi:flagellar hook protein FlgE [Inediibacterium massiliense]|uniref:flagellar hook protein FlgE n=1 Tax=Inediibacterium massiliense TaxID=1658111 RepID=UPI0006B4B25C|nr:flagellar hook protein FlgE [Inediibacterium massiliense]